MKTRDPHLWSPLTILEKKIIFIQIHQTKNSVSNYFDTELILSKKKLPYNKEVK